VAFFVATAQAAAWPVFVDAGWVGENFRQPRVKLIEMSDAVSYAFDEAKYDAKIKYGRIPGSLSQP
jgi:hypothetical protein